MLHQIIMKLYSKFPSLNMVYFTVKIPSTQHLCTNHTMDPGDVKTRLKDDIINIRCAHHYNLGGCAI